MGLWLVAGQSGREEVVVHAHEIRVHTTVERRYLQYLVPTAPGISVEAYAKHRDRCAVRWLGLLL